MSADEREAAKQATPQAELINQLLDPGLPKTEREHAAAKEIEKLVKELQFSWKNNRILEEARQSEMAKRDAAEAEVEHLRIRCEGYQASRDWAITKLAGALGREHDVGRPVEFYSQEAASEIEQLRAELAKHQESKFHPDWSMLDATRASLREHQAEIGRLQKLLGK